MKTTPVSPTLTPTSHVPSNPDDSVATSSISRRSNVQTAVLVVKFALIAVIAWLVISTVAAVFEWGRGTSPVGSIDDTVSEESFSPPPVPPILLTAFEDGTWEFVGMPWQIRMATVEPGEIEEELTALPPATEFATTKSSAEGDQLVAMFRKLGANERKHGQLTLLSSGSSGGRMMLIVRQGPQGESVVLGRIAWPEEGLWRLIEGRPVAIAKTVSSPAKVPPPADDAEVVGTRWGKDGTLLGQILTIAAGQDSLVAAWKQAGWSVRRSPTAIGTAEEDPLLLVERDGVCYAAHFFAPAGGPATLFLTRVPE